MSHFPADVPDVDVQSIRQTLAVADTMALRLILVIDHRVLISNRDVKSFGRTSGTSRRPDGTAEAAAACRTRCGRLNIPVRACSQLLRTALLAAVVAIGTTACRTGRPYRNPVQARGVENQAYNSGYRDGLAQGRDDGRHNRRPNPRAARRYRSGDHDYNRRYGTRDEYRRVYRTAFEQGYEVGYRGRR
jgi:hypothetical protein